MVDNRIFATDSDVVELCNVINTEDLLMSSETHWDKYPNMEVIDSKFGLYIHIDHGENQNWLYNLKMNKVFIKLNSVMTVTVSYKPYDSANLSLRAMIVYTSPDDMHLQVRRSAIHKAANKYSADNQEVDQATLQRKRDGILNELNLLRSQHDISVASDFTAVRFCDTSHYLTLSITKDLDVIPSEHSLPDPHKWFQPTGTVTSYVNEFTKSLEQLEEFYSNINAIVELCFVVDPLQPSTKNNTRIFKIDQKCFVKVVIDPLLPSSITVTFIAPTLRVEHYRSKYEQEISNWNHDLDVHKNLLKICGLVYFPMRTSQDEEDMPSCSICGMFRLDDTIPMITCDHIKCDLLFHVGCLKQWWSMSTADCKTFLNIELGTKCPMCKEKLSASFEQLFSDREN